MYFLREIVNVRLLEGHPNIIKFLSAHDNIEDENRYKTGKNIPSIRSLYMNKAVMTFDRYLESQSMQTKQKTKEYAYQLVNAIEYCHQNGIIHRDIKPSNILIFEDGTLQLADFGLSKMADLATGIAYTHPVVSLWWKPPELLLGQAIYTSKIDIWSIGVILLTAFLGYNPFKGGNEIDQLNLIFSILGTPTEETWPGIEYLADIHYPLPKRTIEIDPLELKVTDKCLAWEPTRANATEVLNCEYFDSVRQNMEEKYPVKEIDSDLFISPLLAPYNYKIIEHRKILFKWLVEIKKEYVIKKDPDHPALPLNDRIMYTTLISAFYIFDKYLEITRDIAKADIQGYGSAALLIAIKLYEYHYIVDLQTFVFLSDRTFTAQKLHHYELTMLSTLNYVIKPNPCNLYLISKPQSTEVYDKFVELYTDYSLVSTKSPQELVDMAHELTA